jgi:hypothetical protein
MHLIERLRGMAETVPGVVYQLRLSPEATSPSPT